MNKFAKEYLIKEITEYIEKEPKNSEQYGAHYSLGYAIGILKGIRETLKDELNGIR